VFPINSVALRERREDIPLLTAHFLASACRRFSREGLRLSKADVLRLQAYDWPGNVRELQNVLERAAIISGGGHLKLELPDTGFGHPALPAARQQPVRPHLMTEQDRRRRDREMIEQALDDCDGKVSGPGGAAELLGLKPTTLASRIKRWGIDYQRLDGKSSKGA
jgi:DNA-binding NtrC family response regulator